MSPPVDLSGLPPIQPVEPGQLFTDLIGTIETAILDRPRSAQVRLGPSEIGIPCPRRLAHKLAGTRSLNSRRAAWRPTVGVAVHEWLAGVFIEANRPLHPARWLVEHKVEAGMIGDQVLDGSCDLYDRATATVIDWKIVGPAALKNYRSGNPGAQYVVQANTYGLGWTRRGMPVRHVAVVFLPAAGELSEAVFWSAPYDEQMALDAIARVNTIAALVAAGGPAAPGMLPTADAWCVFCPWYLPAATDLTEACPGHVTTPRAVA